MVLKGVVWILFKMIYLLKIFLCQDYIEVYILKKELWLDFRIFININMYFKKVYVFLKNLNIREKYEGYVLEI